MVSKRERLEEIWRRLYLAPASSNHDEAFELLAKVFRQVEDELTEIPHAPENWQTDGRMYPPQEDNARDVAARKDLVRYRNRGHNTYIRSNGAIEIRDHSEVVVFEKAGANGASVDLEE